MGYLDRVHDSDFYWAASETITVDNTAGGVGFTSATYKPTSGDREDQCAQIAKVSVETANLRWTQDGSTAPTTTVGVIQYPADIFYVRGTMNIKNFKAIRTGGTSSSIKVQYGW